MSQEKLGEAIGLTFQQVQKYERGSNRISAGTLYRLGQVLDVPVSFFFDSYNDPGSSRRLRGSGDEVEGTGTQISRREARLLRLWRAAPAHVSDEMLSLLSALSPEIKESPEGPEDCEDGKSAAAPQDEGPPKTPERSSSRPADNSVTAGEADGAVLEAAEVRGPSRTVRSDAPRVKTVKSTDNSNKARRRHGAVWDPTDILRASKPPPRT